MSEPPSRRYLPQLSLGALGVVYGDIGTSPLYALRESFRPEHGLPLTTGNVLGVLSLILWSLLLVISVKYLVFVLRADHEDEGGILALASLATPMAVRGPTGRRALVVLGLIGTALLFGDGAITPAISVLSAVEGLQIVTPIFAPYVGAITIGILVGLFAVQRFGTGGVGRVFGPIIFLWFVTLAVLGVSQIVRVPAVLAALDPRHALAFFEANGWHGFVVLGSIFLVVTGGEALYADLGHFGRQPIRRAWFVVVLPALVLNYFGQGALVLGDPRSVSNPFYLMTPRWALLPVVILATVATVIASQALISGAFSLTMQAVRLGALPRLTIRHTSAAESGQIYAPAVNWTLLIACIALVLGFGTSSRLAGAYGVAVTTTMVITTVLFYVVARERWRWSAWIAAPLCLGFLVIDLAFWDANLLKIPDGGWFPLVVGGGLLLLLLTWRRGRQLLTTQVRRGAMPAGEFAAMIERQHLRRVPGTAVFMIGERGVTPPALLHNLKHNRVLHELVLLLTVETDPRPHLPDVRRLATVDLGSGVHEVTVRFGFLDDPDVPSALVRWEGGGDRPPLGRMTFFLARETVVRSKRRGGLGWRVGLFEFLNRNALPASSFFHLPPNRVVELGAQVEL
ncbi:MAG TPA: potassium transporter Kup [Gemmatimonadales bacterium]|nr:potassium transporter Kup [Gemmatimonadales bacterium]